MKTKTTTIPQISRHPVYFRIFAVVSGKILLILLIMFFSVYKKPRLPRTRALVVFEDNILLIKNITDAKHWTLPGGGVKKTELLEEALAREIREEINVHYQPNEYRFIRHYKKHEINGSFDKVCYLLRLNDSNDHNIKPSIELLDLQWFKLSELPSNLSVVANKILQEHSDLIK